MDVRERLVSMHLLVLSAFRPGAHLLTSTADGASQCTFWCSVLSDRARSRSSGWETRSQCTFWCLVLSDRIRRSGRLSRVFFCLNAPSGAQCFPTQIHRQLIDNTDWYWSQCTFWCSVLSDARDGRVEGVRQHRVSMHLLVLCAFRHHGRRSGI